MYDFTLRCIESGWWHGFFAGMAVGLFAGILVVILLAFMFGSRKNAQ